ncbi:MAG: ABC transporter ATP-binding protein [Deltaproteobacteria bacterium]|jgi:putative ABC transport system ATP-binding protein|nr:ABC transporter ATP-binding protein [Deltaproteobacteria bacterium]
MIELQNIRKVFNEGRPNEYIALHDLSLTVAAHQVTALTGPSGSGKTTLLSLLGCMARPTAGRIVLAGREITSLPERFLTDIRRKTFGFIFQQFNLVNGISVIENVMLPAYTMGEPFATLKQHALGLLELFNMAHKAAAKVEWLSGGEAQRTAIARALINRPEVIIADEPTAHLDTSLSREFMDILRDFKFQGKTILIASHDPLVHESDVVDRVVRMRDGRIIDSGEI